MGPKRYDLEVRDIKSGKPLGRILFELDVKQYQTMTVGLREMKLSLNGKEERSLFSQFKVISNNNIPRTSDGTETLKGTFKKQKNQTSFKWEYPPDEVDQGPEVNYDVAMETLKNSTIQIFMKVDYAYSEIQTEKILENIQKRNAEGRHNTSIITPS